MLEEVTEGGAREVSSDSAVWRVNMVLLQVHEPPSTPPPPQPPTY